MADNSFLKHKHPDYIRYVNEWEFFWQSFEGGQDYILGGDADNRLGSDIRPLENVGTDKANLIMHKRETEGTYDGRLKRAFYLNYCGAIIDTYVSHLNKKEPAVNAEGVQGWDDFTKNVNRMGDSLVEFRHDFQTAAMALGHCFILVDKPVGEAMTRQDEIDKGLAPFYTLYYPWDIWDWQLDQFGEPYWIKIVEKNAQRIDPTNQAAVKKKRGIAFKIWTRTEWIKFDESGKELGRGEHNLGKVPLVPVYNRKRQRSRMLGLSAINDIAYVNRRIFNIGSLIDEFAYRACFPMLRKPREMGDDNDELKIAETIIMEFPDTAKHPPEWINPDTEPMEFLAGEIETSEQKIYRLARLEAGFEARAKQPASGISKAFDFMETATVLSQKADNFEEAENKAADLWLEWNEIDPDKITVDYPDNFDVRTLEKDLDEATQLSTMFISETIMNRIMNKLVDKIDPKIANEERQKITKEIETNVKAMFIEHQFGATLVNDSGSNE